MPCQAQHLSHPPTRAEVGVLPGATLLEFGTPWCGHCLAAQPRIEHALQGFDGVTHLKVEDGPGQPLGRSYRVELWPTLVFLRDGQEVARLVKPQDAAGDCSGVARSQSGTTVRLQHPLDASEKPKLQKAKQAARLANNAASSSLHKHLEEYWLDGHFETSLPVTSIRCVTAVGQLLPFCSWLRPLDPELLATHRFPS